MPHKTNVSMSFCRGIRRLIYFLILLLKMFTSLCVSDLNTLSSPRLPPLTITHPSHLHVITAQVDSPTEVETDFEFIHTCIFAVDLEAQLCESEEGRRLEDMCWCEPWSHFCSYVDSVNHGEPGGRLSKTPHLPRNYAPVCSVHGFRQQEDFKMLGPPYLVHGTRYIMRQSVGVEMERSLLDGSWW